MSDMSALLQLVYILSFFVPFLSICLFILSLWQLHSLALTCDLFVPWCVWTDLHFYHQLQLCCQEKVFWLVTVPRTDQIYRVLKQSGFKVILLGNPSPWKKHIFRLGLWVMKFLMVRWKDVGELRIYNRFYIFHLTPN